jgi:hypothetical protein
MVINRESFQRVKAPPLTTCIHRWLMERQHDPLLPAHGLLQMQGRLFQTPTRKRRI